MEPIYDEITEADVMKYEDFHAWILSTYDHVDHLGVNHLWMWLIGESEEEVKKRGTNDFVFETISKDDFMKISHKDF